MFQEALRKQLCKIDLVLHCEVILNVINCNVQKGRYSKLKILKKNMEWSKTIRVIRMWHIQV